MPAVYYRDSAGKEPVDAFISALPVEHQLSIDAAIELLNRVRPNEPPLPFPHSSQVEGPLRELRCHHGRTLYRVLYRRSDNLFILLHIIRKNTGRLPSDAIATAKERWDDFSARMNAPDRQPPRAAGHDAP